MNDDQRKEILELLERSSQDYFNPFLKPYRTSDETQERKNGATEFLLSWLNSKTDEHPLFDDFISSIQDKPREFIAVVEAIGVLIALKIIQI